MIQRTLVLLKPDAVKRGIIGEIIMRFEKAGLKIVGMKMVWPDEELVSKHYSDIAKRKGEKVFKLLKEYLTIHGPVVAMVLEGVEAVDIVRKIVGETEPKKALPGTIRGDYCHVSVGYADKKEKAIYNIVHASGSEEEAKKEIELWFDQSEIHDYKRFDQDFVM